MLQQRRREDKLKLPALRAQLKLGVDALRCGDFDEVDETDLHGYLESRMDPTTHLDDATQRGMRGKKRRP